MGEVKSITCVWTITKQSISAKPSLETTEFEYTGLTITPEWKNYNPSEVDMQGQTSAYLHGLYQTVFTPKPNYCWADGTTDPVTVEWKIKSFGVAIPTQKGTLTYNGSPQQPQWNDYPADGIASIDITPTANAGTYTATFTLEPGQNWVTGSTKPISVEWTIGKASILTVPAQSGTLSYNGGEQNPEFSNYDPAKFIVTGDTGIEAGTYVATFTPTTNYKWNDGSEFKEVSWSIERFGVTAPALEETVLTYNGEVQIPEFEYDLAFLELTSGGSATNAGNYTARFTLKDTVNTYWSDGTTATYKDINWSIKNAVIAAVPSQSSTLIYSGESQSPSWSNFDSNKLIVNGETSGTEAGTYTAIFTPKVNYEWADGTTVGKNVDWTISRKTLSVPSQSGTLTYTGASQSPSWNNYNPTQLILTGTTSELNAGSYTATFTPKDNYCWPDGTFEPKDVTWSIGRQTVSVPSQSGSLTYSGNAQSPEWTGYDDTKLTLAGSTSETDAGTYNVTFTPKGNWKWTDGTTAAKTVSWSIGRLAISVPSVSGSLTYNGAAQSPTWVNYDASKMTIGGTTSSTNAGTFSATFTPKSNWCWDGGSTSAKSVNWTIGRLAISTAPSQSGSVTYTGSSQSPTWSNYDSNKLTLGGTTSATNAGTHNATFTPKSNWCWSDGDTSAKTVSWSIGKATGTLSLSPTTLTFYGTSSTKTITATSNISGAVTATSGNTSIATVSVSSKTITVTPKAKGTVTITVSIDGGTNYTTPTSQTCSVTVNQAVTIPTASTTSYTYTGSSISLGVSNYNSTYMTQSGTTSATNVGEYTVTYALKSGYCWTDGTTGDKSISWSITRAVVSLPTQSGTLTYSGSSQSPSWNNYSTSKLTIGGTTSGTNAGSYTATFTPTSNYKWSDGTTSAKNATWTIGKLSLTVPSQSGSLTYSGSAQSPSWNNYNSSRLSLSGTTSGTSAGSYTATFALNSTSNYQWSDGTTSSKSVTWTIGRLAVTVPSQSGSLTYNGSSKSPSWNNYSSTQLTLGGTTSGTNAGDYTATFTPKSNWCWSGGSTSAKNVTWTIGKAAGTLSLNKSTMTFNGVSGTQTITATSNISGAVTATSSNTSVATVSVSSKTVTVTPKAKGTATITISIAGTTNYSAPTSQTCSVTVNQAVTIPTISTSSFTYTGSTIYAYNYVSDYSTTYMTRTGTASASAVGSYTMTYTLKSGYCWSDGTTGVKTIDWSITKATGTLSISPTSLSFDGTGSSNAKTITATSNISGNVTATSSATSKATVSASGKTVTVTPVADGSATITVGISGGTNYTTPTSKTCSVTIASAVDSLSLSASQFQTYIKNGQGSSAFAVGDRLSIPFSGTLTGTAANYLSNTGDPIELTGTLYPCILGFNHNKSTEGGTLTHYADIQFSHTQNGDKALAIMPSTGGFKMRTTLTNSGGWNGSLVNTTTCSAFLNLMNASWKNIVVNATKYTDNTGGKTNTASCVTATSSKIWLLAEYEILGKIRYANAAEQNKQLQYSFYANGGSATRYNFVDTNAYGYWWTRSCCCTTATNFAYIAWDGNTYDSEAYGTHGFAPGARIA